MKRIIKKSLSVFLMLIMLVPLIGIMTSAEELNNIYEPPKTESFAVNRSFMYGYDNFNIKPGDVVTMAPVSLKYLSSFTTALRTQNEKGGYSVKSLNNLSVLPYSSDYITESVGVVTVTIPEDGSNAFLAYVLNVFSKCTLITVNQPFSAAEYLDYAANKGFDLSVLYPEEYTGEFVNVFPKSDTVFSGWLTTTKDNNKKTIVVEKENTKYYTSAPISVKEGDLVCLAGGYYQIWLFNSAGKYVRINRTQTIEYCSSNKGCKIDAFVVPKDTVYMRVVAYAANYQNGEVVVTVNQPMVSANAYNSCRKIKISGLEKEYTYTGAVIKPAIELKIGGNVLKLGKDYKLTYGNKTVGNKKLIITFINNYAYLGKVVYSYRIVPKPVDVIWSNTQLVYNGENQAPVGEVVGLIGSDKCNVVVDGAVKCGSYISAVRLSNKNYTLAKNATCEYTISPKPVELVWESTSAVYNGNYQAPVAKVLGIVENDICDVIVSGAGKDVGTYVASAAISNPNYVISENTACSFAIAPKGVILTWSNTELFYTGRPQQPTALIFGLENNDVCNVLISGKGEELGSYTAVATLSNPNYFVAANAICNFTIIKSPIHESVGMPAEFVIDVLAIVPDSAEKAAAEAVNNAAEEAVEAASEAAQEAASEIAESVSNSFENIFDNLFSFFKNFGW